MEEHLKIIIDYKNKTITQQFEKIVDDEGNEIEEITCFFNDDFDLLSFLIPENFTHKDFEKLESIFMQEHLPEGIWFTIADYGRYANCTRKTIYNKINRGELEVNKIGKYTYVKEKEIK